MALTDNLVAYYKLDGNSNDSVGSNNGTDTNVSYSSSYGKINQGGSFNGSSSKIDVSDNAFLAGSYSNFSIMFWFQNNNSAGATMMFRKGWSSSRHWQGIRFQGGVLPIFYNSSGSTVSFPTYSISDNNWHHLVMVFNYSTAKVYVDEELRSTTTFNSNVVFGNDNPINIGYNQYGDGITAPAMFFKGNIDELGIWSRALSSTEVGELYNSGAGLTYPFTTFNPHFSRRKLL